MGFSMTSDHIIIMIKIPNSSQEQLTSLNAQIGTFFPFIRSNLIQVKFKSRAIIRSISEFKLMLKSNARCNTGQNDKFYMKVNTKFGNELKPKT